MKTRKEMEKNSKHTNSSMMNTPESSRQLTQSSTGTSPKIDALAVISVKRTPLCKKILLEGETDVKAEIVRLITSVASQLNISKNMNAGQIFEIAEFILSNYRLFSIEDIKCCLSRGVTGTYGKMYDRLDIEVFGGWLRTYDAERDEAREMLRQKENGEHKQNAGIISNSLKVAKIIGDAVAQFEAKKAKRKAEKVPDRLRILMQQFDILWTDSGLMEKGERTIIISGKKVNLKQFIENDGK